MIRRVKPDKRGEIQLTDAIQFMCEEGRRVMAVKLTPEEKRYDIGNFPSYFESFVEFALADPVYGAEFRRVLERLLAKSADHGLTRTRSIFLLLFALLLAARLCHVDILWAEETLPLAAAAADARTARCSTATSGSTSRRCGARALPALRRATPGGRCVWPDALYALLAAGSRGGFARDLWCGARRPLGRGAAGLLPDLRFPRRGDSPGFGPADAGAAPGRRVDGLRAAARSGAASLAGVALWISPKGVLVLAVCAIWEPAGILWMAAGFAAVCAAGAAWLWSAGALAAYWEEVWTWGRLYAGSTFVESPVRNGLVRTLNWMGFHAALVAASAWFLWKGDRRLRWVAWLVIAAAGVAAGLRFFPRYYFLLLPVLVLMAARGFMLLGRRRELVALLLLIPLARFGPPT